jgi:hypothetical protein
MDYQDGFEDGVKFTREVIIANIQAIGRIIRRMGRSMDDIADRLEFGTGRL